MGWLKINIRKIKRRSLREGLVRAGIGMDQEEGADMGIEIRIFIRIKVRLGIRGKGRGNMVKDRGMDKINMVINTKVKDSLKVNTAIKDIRTKDTRIKTKINIEDKAIMAIPDHTIRINIILDSMLVLVNYHLHSLLRGIILRTSPFSLPLSFLFPISSNAPPSFIVQDSVSRREANR